MLKTTRHNGASQTQDAATSHTCSGPDAKAEAEYEHHVHVCVCVRVCVNSFNHLMAIQMSGGGARVRLGPSHPLTLHPDLNWLEQQMSGPNPPKLVVITNPCNPVGHTHRHTHTHVHLSCGAWVLKACSVVRATCDRHCVCVCVCVCMCVSVCGSIGLTEQIDRGHARVGLTN